MMLDQNQSTGGFQDMVNSHVATQTKTQDTPPPSRELPSSHLSRSMLDVAPSPAGNAYASAAGYSPRAATPAPNKRDALIREGLPIVRRLAFRLARRLPPSVEVGDLIGAGNEGLVKAAENFDSERYPRFAPYAEQRIRGAMLDELRAMDPVTRHGRRRMADVSKAIRELTQETGTPPEEAAIAQRLGMDIPSYRKLSADLAKAPALGHVGDMSPEDVAGRTQPPDARLLDMEVKGQVADAIRNLPERTQHVLALYYQEECTQLEIGHILSVTEGRVCQILGEAAARIRANMGLDPLPKKSRRRKASKNQGSGR